MKGSYELLELINKSSYTISYILQQLNLTKEQFYAKIGNDMDFSSTEIENLINVLNIETPYKIFYGQGGF